MDGLLERLFRECDLQLYVPRKIVLQEELERLSKGGLGEKLLEKIHTEEQRRQAYYGRQQSLKNSNIAFNRSKLSQMKTSTYF